MSRRDADSREKPVQGDPLESADLVLRAGDVTLILAAIEQGEPRASEQRLPIVYDELRTLAAAKMAQEKPGQTLQATALVHEAYLRLVDVQKTQHWNSRGHFYCAAAEAMRRILVENARRKERLKRGGGLQPRAMQEVELECHQPCGDMLAVDEALEKLAAHEPQAARVVQLRFFAGLNHQEAADVLGISAVTVQRYWRYARAWLQRELADA
jgi:RNA polymerase sigma factor (TIGR02999 family)